MKQAGLPTFLVRRMRRASESLFGKSIWTWRSWFGVPPSGSADCEPPEGGTPNGDFQTGSLGGLAEMKRVAVVRGPVRNRQRIFDNVKVTGSVVLVPFLVVLTSAVSSAGNAAVQWENGSGFRSAPLALPSTGKTGFTRLPATATGIHFTNFLS